MFLKIMGDPRVFRIIGNPVMVPYHSPNYNLVPCSMPVEGKCPACKKFSELENATGEDRIKAKYQLHYYSVSERYYYNVWSAQMVDPPEERRWIDPPTSDLNKRVFEVLWVNSQLQKLINCKIDDDWKNLYYEPKYSNWLFNPADRHPERLAFIKSILANPTDTTMKLVFADWLQDHEDYNRAEGMRIFCLNKQEMNEEFLQRFIELRNKTPELNPFDAWDGLDFSASSHRGDRDNDYKDVYVGDYVECSSRPIGTIDEIESGLKLFNIANFAKQGNSKQVQKVMDGD